MKQPLCATCGQVGHYKTFCRLNRKPLPRPTTTISRYGQRAQTYAAWRDTIAIPYLDKKYGHRCVCCGTDKRLDVDHIKGRGTNPELKYELSNVRFLCRPCHRARTDGAVCYHTDK